MQLAHGSTPLPTASDGVWQASIVADAQAAVLHVKRLGTPPELKTNAHFLPPGIARTDGEWQITTLALAKQRLTVVLRLSPRPGGKGNSQDKIFEFDLSQRAAPLVKFDTVTLRNGRYDVHHFDLMSRTSAWCRTQETPDLSNCKPVIEPLLAQQSVADIGLEGMPSAESYVPPVVPTIVYGAPTLEAVPLPQPAR
jgi:hypothetical protein